MLSLKELIHIYENSRLVSEHFTEEGVTAAYVEGLAALYNKNNGGAGAVWILHGHWNMPDDSGVNIWGVSPDMELLQNRLYEIGDQMVADALDSPQEVEFDNIETSETKYEAENSEGYFIRLYITLNDVDIGKGRHK